MSIATRLTRLEAREAGSLVFQPVFLFLIETFALCDYSILGIPLRGLLSARLVAMYIAVAIRPSSYVHRVTSEVAVSFLPEVVAQF